MKFGFYEFDITPPINSIIPGDFTARRAKDVIDKIYARAFVAQKNDTKIATVVLDACGVTAEITEKIRKRVSLIMICVSTV